jgi:serine/threonine-protein kinase HipA
MAERTVFIYLPEATTAVPAGRLSMAEDGIEVSASRFAYGRRYVQRPQAVPVDPISLPLGEGDDADFVPVNGLSLFGALRDATPDSWGRRVIENKLRAPPNGLPEWRYMDEAGPYRAGALDIRYGPEDGVTHGSLPGILDLQYLQEAAERIVDGEPVPARLASFFEGGPSVGGARPKAVVQVDGHEWIAKFPAKDDRFDIPLVEFATLKLAAQAGLNVPPIRLETLPDGRNIMLIQRFDRQATPFGTARRHMVSALTMLGLHERESPDATYGAIADALGQYGVSGRISGDREELFARMVFNILVSNDDDHLRNHAFLYENEGWRLSPLYDVVPKPQVALERTLHLGVGRYGRSATLDNALSGAGWFGLLAPDASGIADRIIRTVREWRVVFEEAGATTRQCDTIASAFRRAGDIGGREVERHLV